MRATGSDLLRFPALSRALAACALTAATVSGCDCGDTLVDAAPIIEVNPAEVVFGSVAVGAAGEQFVDVTNIGRGTLEITRLEVTAGSPEIALAKEWKFDCQGAVRPEAIPSLGPGECARFAVRAIPTASRAVVGTIALDSNDGGRPTVEIPVKADGVVSGIEVCLIEADGTVKEENCSKVAADPPVIPTIDFGTVGLNEEGVRKVRVKNIGDGPLVIMGADVDHSDESSPDFALTAAPVSQTLAKAQSMELEVKFQPLDAASPVTSGLFIPSNDPGVPNLRLPITAKVNGPELCVTPAEGLDFGDVVVGADRSLTMNFKNCGYVKYRIQNFDFVEDNLATKEYTVAGSPTLPLDFAPGAEFTITVKYEPHAVTPTNGAGDTASVSVKTDYKRGRFPVVGKGASPSCNGGAQPVAKIKVFANSAFTQDITANPQREPLETAFLDGTTSTVRSGGVPSYVWRLVRQPQNGNVNVTASGVGKARLFLELSGEYEVELVVKDQFGCQSVPKTVVIKSQPKSKLHVELAWPESFGDVDLHLLGPAGRFFDSGGLFSSGSDCFYMNCKRDSRGNPTLDWGYQNTTAEDGNNVNDPSLDIDALWGSGPENITMENPFNATYKVIVHYYCSRVNQGSGASRGAASPRLKIFVDGVEKLNVTKSITQRDVWEAAQIDVSNGAITVTALTTNTRKSTGQYEGCTSDTN